jgi:phage tail-like protein
MDANGLRFWMLADRAHWMDAPELQWDDARRSLRLASQRRARPGAFPTTPEGWTALASQARALLEQVPRARDAHGTRARWDATERRVVASGAFPDEVPILALWRDGLDATDVALGHDGVLYAAADGEVLMHDRRGRRRDERVRLLGFDAWRLAADPAGGAWVLDRAGRLARTDGQLWPDRPFESYDPGTFRPDPENPVAPRLRVYDRARWADETAAIACSPGGRVAVLTWGADGRALLRVLMADGALSDPLHLAGAFYPHTLAWAGDRRVAVMMKGQAEAAAFGVPAEDGLARTGAERELARAGDVYPLRGLDEGPFAHTVTGTPEYPTLDGTRPLYALSLPGFAPRGEAMNLLLLDSVESGTQWHRLYVEAAVPPRCSITLHLAATESPAAPADGGQWHAHHVGDVPADGQAPRAAWVAGGTEVPFADPLLAAEAQPGRAGLWTALVQRPGRAVRALRGRYLWVRAELRGDGRASPELAAVRAYGSRFSYRDRYLPELYRESVFGGDADAAAERSTPADFLDRFLGNFEGVLTGIEDRIAHAYLATDARTAPAESLEWLAGWIGFAFDAGVPAERRRRMLQAAPELAVRRGTVDGLKLALELATGGAVSGGEIVVLEDWKLRRTFATILGADLADEDDPLTAGLAVSGNSYVGDTLFLGDEGRREFLALYDAGLDVNAWEQAAIADFFERLAHRVTVLVHTEVEAPELGLIRRVVERELPAHVEGRVLQAPGPLMVGVSSLIGVDTYLARKPGTTPVRVDVSSIGVRDHLVTPVSLDPRLEGGYARLAGPPPSAGGSGGALGGSLGGMTLVGGPIAPDAPELPVARFTEERAEAGVGGPILLDGTPSTAAEGRALETFRWAQLPGPGAAKDAEPGGPKKDEDEGGK